MATNHIGHQHIAKFADEHVNLKRDDAKKYRDQVNHLREELAASAQLNSDFQLKRILLSGSLAKGTALKNINDIDVAVYISQNVHTRPMQAIIDALVQALKNRFPTMAPDQFTRQHFSVCISFRGTGLDVDVVPISYNNDPEWNGFLYSASTNEWLLTNIYKHIDFIKKRKQKHGAHYAQVIRLLKYWVKEIKKKDDIFKFKSFLVELIVAHLADHGSIQFDDYVEALAGFFNFIVRGGLDSKITHTDYFSVGNFRDTSDAIQIFDPVNPANNVAKGYTRANKTALVGAAADAADAVDAAIYAHTKGEAVRHWQKIFGSSFGG